MLVSQFGILPIINEVTHMSKSYFRDAYFWFALLIVLVTIILSVANYFRYLQLHFYVGPFFFHHWLSLTGTLLVAFFVPAFYVLRRRYSRRGGTLIRLHCLGNLL